MIRRHPAPHSLAGAYAMDALDPVSQRKFSRHLTRCRECADEITELREVAGRLALASASAPPALMREQVLGITERVRQLPPIVGNAAHGRFAPTMARRRRLARSPRLAMVLATAAVVAAAVMWITCWP